MGSLGLTWFDGIAGLIVLVSAVYAYHTGVVREILTILAFVAAALVAILFTDPIEGIVSRLAPLHGVLATIGVGLVLALATFVLIKVLAGKLALTVDRSEAGNALDRGAGFVYGAVRGALLVALFLIAMRMITGDPDKLLSITMPDAITHSESFPFYDAIADAVVKLAHEI